jgi:hypothetical protein
LFVALGGTAWAVAANSVGTRELKNGAVSAPKLKAGAVTTLKVANGAVTAPKLAATAWRLVATNHDFNCKNSSGNRTGEFCGDDYAGWSNYVDQALGYAPASFAKDASGVVHLQWLVKCTGNGGSAACETGGDSIIFVLPPGLRPGGRLLFAVAANVSEFARVDVLPNGEVRWVAGAHPYNGDLSLSGISFRATH